MANDTTILICDDEDVLRALVTASLAGEGYRIVEARDGDEALELAREERPDLIVIDMMMPGRSGLDVVRQLRIEPAFTATPVIVLTARAQAADREAAENAGVDRYLAKPFSPAVLASTVEELLRDRG